MYNAPYQGVANDLSQYGRFGDSQLVHMNPIEVQMLASMSPTGELTTNPVTGQPEAFLPFLAPLLGSFLGKAFLPTLIPALTGKAALAGAIGSGLATTAATGNLKEGIMSGLTGFGLGKVFGALGGAGDATKAAADTATKFADLPTNIDVPLSSMLPQQASALTGMPTIASSAGGMGSAIDTAAAASPSSGLNFAAAGQELMKPGTFLPIYAGVSATEGMRQQEELERIMREQGLSEEEAKRKYEEDARRAIETAQRLYPQMRPQGMAAGGQVERYFDGGMFGMSDPSSGMYNTQFGQSSPSDIQGRLRGTVNVAPPYASYGALDVGGQGYLPGISPEFQYFRQPEEVYPQQPMMGRGKGGGFGGGMPGGFGSGMPGGKGGGFGNQFGSPFGRQFGRQPSFGGMPSKGGYANPRNSMGFGGYNTGFNPYQQPYSSGGFGMNSGRFNSYVDPFMQGFIP